MNNFAVHWHSFGGTKADTQFCVLQFIDTMFQDAILPILRARRPQEQLLDAVTLLCTAIVEHIHPREDEKIAPSSIPGLHLLLKQLYSNSEASTLPHPAIIAIGRVCTKIGTETNSGASSQYQAVRKFQSSLQSDSDLSELMWIQQRARP